MTKPLLLPLQLTHLVTADDLAANLLTAALGGKPFGPRASTLNNIRARARAVRPL